VTDPRSGIVYMTEDCGDPADGFYRYLPDNPRKLHEGGRLQMLAVQGRSRYDTPHGQKVGRKLRCAWVAIDDPDPEDADQRPNAVFQQGREKGAAQFMALEGRSGRAAAPTSPPAKATTNSVRSGATRRRG